MFDIDISEFLNNIKNFVFKDLIEFMRDACIRVYTQIFDQANQATENAAAQLSTTPENMFPTVYKMVESVVETCFVPIGGIILVCILCYECVNMLVESNRMREFGPQDIYILFFKMLIGVLLLTHSFEIVNGAFKIGQWAVQHVAIESVNANLDEQIDAISYIQEIDSIYDMYTFLWVGTIIKFGIVIFSAIVHVVVWMRFIELYMFMVSSPIPFATFLNKEWGQVGYNYVRKILSLAFQPVYMIFCFSIFGAVLAIQAENVFMGLSGAMMKVFAAMILLVLSLFKTKTISESIFNAH